VSSKLLWSALGLVFLAFSGWYSSFEGPLRPEEIERYVKLMEDGGAAAEDVAQLREFLEGDTGDDFAMLNVIELRESPLEVEGVEAGESAEEVLARYMAFMWPNLLSRACHPVSAGRAAAVALDVWGIENASTWSQGALMRYRSRRDLMEIATDPGFRGPHEFKEAAMLKTIAFPIDPWFHLGDPRLLLGLFLLCLGLAFQALRRRRR